MKISRKALVPRVAESVRAAMAGEGSGHDWWHVWRVWRLAERLARTEPRSDRAVVALGALLHDLGDWKFHGGDEAAAPEPAAHEGGPAARPRAARLPGGVPEALSRGVEREGLRPS